jgi:hypothetical protein
MKVTFHTEKGKFGPVNAGPARQFWCFGLIPTGTVVTLGLGTPMVAIEECPELNRFSKTTLTQEVYFNGQTLVSQRARMTANQDIYIQELGWPFPIAHLNYYQADFLWKRLEECFPERLRAFVDPENPWRPGATKPMNLILADHHQRAYLNFLGIQTAEWITAKDAAMLISEHDSPEKQRQWRDARNAWKKLPASNRQLKVLRFFGCYEGTDIKRGTASTVITRIFADEDNVMKWENYKVMTGDFGDESPELKPLPEFPRASSSTDSETVR